jgi:mRNA-degrading endonuclease RelE of RelBE toxin-antitoxin system
MSTPQNDDPALPPRDGDAPLHELTRDQLTALLLAAFTGDELLELLRGAKVQPGRGYRLESLDDLGRADLLADELRAVPAARAGTMALLRKAYEFPALEGVVLPRVVAEELSALAVEPDAPIRILWRLIADPSKEIREAAAAGLEYLADELLGTEPPPPVDGQAPQPAPVVDEARALRKEASKAGAQAERARARSVELKDQLKAARAEVVRVERELSLKAREASKTTAELERTKEKLEKARQKSGSDEREKLTRERDELLQRVQTLDVRLKEAAATRVEVEESVTTLRRQLDEERARLAAPPRKIDEEPALEEVPSSWLFPRFSREFYDSLEKWELRIQRTAFKQAFLLAENHRHPSLRAIPLEGLPGYYRIRIATDVRLIYRRAENQREVEVLSLIDREDLDRYVRQAKTR